MPPPDPVNPHVHTEPEDIIGQGHVRGSSSVLPSTSTTVPSTSQATSMPSASTPGPSTSTSDPPASTVEDAAVSRTTEWRRVTEAGGKGKGPRKAYSCRTCGNSMSGTFLIANVNFDHIYNNASTIMQVQGTLNLGDSATAPWLQERSPKKSG